MATKKSKDNSFAALVARLNAMSNMTKEEERASLMEAANQEPRILDEKEVSLADIAKLAGIKEYQDETKVSPKAEKLVESITKEPAKESIITKAIAEADADDSISTAIRKDVTEEDKRLSKIAELEQQLADLKAEEKEEATLDAEKFKETLISEITEFVKDAEADKLAELYNSFSTNEVEVKEDSFLIKTPETQEIIADAEKAEAPEEEVVQEKEPEAEEPTIEEEPAVEEQPTEEEVGEDDIEIPEEEIEYTDELTEAKKKPVPTSPDKWSRAKAKARSKFDVYPSAYANAYAAKEYKKMGGGWRMGKPKKKK
tara:strand:- start:186 stop:1127 length:942 start_codon:yes stop_codon:yes gene_type:complete